MAKEIDIVKTFTVILNSFLKFSVKFADAEDMEVIKVATDDIANVVTKLKNGQAVLALGGVLMTYMSDFENEIDEELS